MSSPPKNNPRGCGSRGRRSSKNHQVAPQQQQQQQQQQASWSGSNSNKNNNNAAAELTVLVSRVDFYDAGRTDDGHPKLSQIPRNVPPVDSFRYDPSSTAAAAAAATTLSTKTAVCRIPQVNTVVHNPHWMQIRVVDKSIPCPVDANPDLLKYWNQRRRLFSRFDQGIQLDEEGWFSVTPEQIADHVATNLSHLMMTMLQSSRKQQQQQRKEENNFVVLDAFCGCGGNAIAFAKQPNVTVIACDIDRTKLRKAAHNAAIYGIPPERLLLVECNVLFLLEFCYRHGEFVLDQPLATPDAAAKLMDAMPPPAHTELVQPGGYQIGGIDLLPRHVHAVFMDPPWGGMDYEVFGKHGYDLEHNMKIARTGCGSGTNNNNDSNNGNDDNFFDCFLADPRNKQERKAHFNLTIDETNCVNGVQLLTLAAAATHTVLYDVPRNTNRQSLAVAAHRAGYRGNCKWEEHYLNSRLKTVTVYLGQDWSHCLAMPQEEKEGLNNYHGGEE